MPVIFVRFEALNIVQNEQLIRESWRKTYNASDDNETGIIVGERWFRLSRENNKYLYIYIYKYACTPDILRYLHYYRVDFTGKEK